MLHGLTSMFKRVPVAKIEEEQLYDARQKLVEHEAAAEHHGALADMYRRRVARLAPKVDAVADHVAPSDSRPVDFATGRRLAR